MFFELHKEDGFRWSVSVRTLELPIARELETEMVTGITTIVPSGATSSQNHQAYMNLTLAVECVDACLTNVPEIAVLGRLLAAVLPNEACVGGGSNPISQPLDFARDDEVVSFETTSPRPSYIDGSEMTVSPPPGLDEEVDDISWETDGPPFGLGRCQCGLRIPHWDRCCWLCVG